MVKKIIGPPGTGKTTRLISEMRSSGIPWDRIMFASLTKATIIEARERAMKAGATAKELKWFRTQHSVNKALIGVTKEKMYVDHFKDFAKLHNYRFKDVLKPSEISDLSINTSFDGCDDALVQVYDKARNLRVDPMVIVESLAALRPYRASFVQFIERYEAWKDENDYFDFLDLIERGIKDRLVPPVDLIVLDEFQDSSPLLVEQARIWCELVPKVIIAGDFNQAIYEFMGTRPALFKDFPADETLTLTQSYRVPKAIAEKALALIRENRGEEGCTFEPTDQEGMYIQMNNLYRAADAIKASKNENSYFLLARNRWQLSKAVALLRSEGVSCGGKKAELDAVTLCLSKPAILTRYDMEVLIGELFPTTTTKNGLGCWERGAKAAIKKKIKDGFSPLPVSMLRDIGATEDFVAALTTGQVPAGIKLTIEEIRYYENVVRRWGGKLDVVVPSTIHAAKGREADVVILLTGVSKRSYEGERFDQTESERRIYYVAMTRTRKALIVIRDRMERYVTRMV